MSARIVQHSGVIHTLLVCLVLYLNSEPAANNYNRKFPYPGVVKFYSNIRLYLFAAGYEYDTDADTGNSGMGAITYAELVSRILPTLLRAQLGFLGSLYP